ncbi:MAG: YqiJ family protein [Pseudomonadota bacterium]
MITSLFTAPETWPFGVAFALIVGIALIEGLGMLVSLSPSNWLDDLLPDIDGDTGLDRVLGWLHIGKVPSLVLLVLFLMGYAVFGYSLQKVAHGLLGTYLPVWLAGLAAVATGMATVRSLGALIAHIIPRDETSAVSEMSLIGRHGVVSAGAARRGLAAQARVRDAHGRTHYLMVEPDLDDEVFDEGAQILIVRKAGAFYRCIANPHPGLM